MQEEAEQAYETVGLVPATPRSLLRIDVPGSLCSLGSVPMLRDFVAKNPNLQIDVQLLSGDVLLRGGSLDILVQAGAVDDAGLLVRWADAASSGNRSESGVSGEPLA